MRKASVFFTFALFYAASAAVAAEFETPIPMTWVVSECEKWNTATVAMVMAEGDASVLAMPTGSQKHPWIVLRRVPAGAVFIPEDAPFLLETFNTMTEAVARFSSVEEAKIPMLLTTTSGQTLVVYAREAQRRRASSNR